MQYLTKASQAFSVFNRNQKLDFVLRFIDSHSISSCLIVGAIPRRSGQDYQNLIEVGILQNLEHVVFSGLEDDGGLWPNWVQADGTNLPFQDKSFDLVFSNAVIEHVGEIEEQRQFVIEHNRVGNRFILTTPNRFFPIESHTRVLFRHMSGAWKDPAFTRLLSKSDLKDLLPPESKIRGKVLSPTFLAFN